MTRKLSKEEIKDKFDGEELDLSLCNLAKVPVREMVRFFRVRSEIISLRPRRLRVLLSAVSLKFCFIIDSKTPSQFIALFSG